MLLPRPPQLSIKTDCLHLPNLLTSHRLSWIVISEFEKQVDQLKVEAVMYRSLYISGVLFVVIAILCFLIAQNLTSAQNVNRPQRLTWEYQELEMHGGHFDKTTANKLGAEGWELVATFTPSNRDAVSVMILKRQK
jgi:hypothetical protein